MTQDSERRPTPSRRSSRTGRNRPVLVTPGEVTNDAQNEQTSKVPEPAVEAVETAPQATPQANPPSWRNRLPSFFSSVGKSSEDNEQQTEVGKARVARAMREKPAPPATKKEQPASESRSAKPAQGRGALDRARPAASSSRAAPPARPTGLKSRHFTGLIIYLAAAYVIGIPLSYLMTTMHWNVLLFQFTVPFVNLPVPVSTTTIVYLVILIGLLVVLTMMDMMPRMTPAQPKTPPAKGAARKTADDTDSMERPGSLAMRQGVKGENDDFYREYREQQRYQQRRERKR